MATVIEHAASIAIAKLKTEGRVDDTIGALLEWIEQLEADADDAADEIARLRHIGEVAKAVMAEKPIDYPITLDNAARACELIDDLRFTLMEIKA